MRWRKESLMRINRYLAKCGLASRRKAEDYIRAGRVMVGGEVLQDLSYQVQAGDCIRVDGKEVRMEEEVFFLYHKPVKVLVSHHDPFHSRLIYDDLPKMDSLFAVGRLDFDSEGLLFVTNRGGLAQTIAHPSYQMEKEYWVFLDHPLPAIDAAWTRAGLTFRGIHYWPDHLEFLTKEEIDGRSYALTDWPPEGSENGQLVKIILHEGKKREVRRFFQGLGYEVIRLIRVRLGPLDIGGLGAGQYRSARPEEISALEEWASMVRKGNN